MDNDGTFILKLAFVFCSPVLSLMIDLHRVERRTSRRKSNEDSSKHVYLYKRSIYGRISEDGRRR